MTSIITTILPFVGLWFVGKKAGITPYKLLIPFYNLFVLAKIAKKSSLFPVWIFIISIIIFIISYASYFLPSSSLEYYVAITGGGNIFSQPIIEWILNSFQSQEVLLLLFGVYLVGFLQILLSPLGFLIVLQKVLLYNLFKPVAQAFGKGGWFALGLVFFPFIFWPILGFDSSKYLYENETQPVAV